MSTETAKPDLGEPVIFCDTHGVDHKALVTTVFTPTCVNVIVVSSDPTKTDQYGRQIERFTSVPKMSDQGAHGYYWRYLFEDKKPYVAPIES